MKFNFSPFLAASSVSLSSALRIVNFEQVEKVRIRAPIVKMHHENYKMKRNGTLLSTFRSVPIRIGS